MNELRRKRIYCFVYILQFLVGITLCSRDQKEPLQEKPMVVVIASYNNKDWYEWNLDSVCAQKYQNYRIIYIDDASTDGTGELARKYLKENAHQKNVTFLQNPFNCGQLQNQYRAIHTCRDDEIIIIVDGDDALDNDQVLSSINKVYANEDVWLTYGQFKFLRSGQRGICSAFPPEVIENRSFRYHKWVSSHLRTFYAWLYKQIKVEDLMWEGKFIPICTDLATMFPMLELAGKHFRYISDVLYLYNNINPLNGYKNKKSLQDAVAAFIQSKAPYPAITESHLTKDNSADLKLLTSDSSSFIYKDFDTALGDRQIRWGHCAPNDKQWFNAWKAGYEKHNPSRITPQETPRIPKIIHQIWLGSQFPDKFKKWQETWKKHHPDWKYKLWTDEDIESFNIINKHAFNNARNYGKKSDIWRYEILNRYGGLYVDVDFECLKPLDILHHCYDFYAGMHNTACVELGNAIIASTPGHPIIKHCMDDIKVRCVGGNAATSTIMETGPRYLTKKLLELYSPFDEGVIVLPPTYFFPLGNTHRLESEIQKRTHLRPESFAVHHWSCSWQ